MAIVHYGKNITQNILLHVNRKKEKTMKLFYLAIYTLAFTGCATNMSMNSPIPLGGNSSVNVNSSGQASGNVNVGGVNVNTTL